MLAVSTALFIASQLVPAAQNPSPPIPPTRADIEAILEKAHKPDVTEQLAELNIVLLADVKDHGENEHDYPLWQKRWALLLGGEKASSETQVNLFGPPIPADNLSAEAPNVTLTTAWNWPSEEQFYSADVIVAFCYLKWNEERFEQMRQYLERGGGVVPVHPASWPDETHFPKAAKLLGIGGYKKFRHGPLDMKITTPDHPICLGLPDEIHWLDETYWPPTPFAEGVTILATSDEIIDSNGLKEPQPVFWTHQYGKGRIFGCQPGHYTWTFDDPYFRILLLRGIAWAAGDNPYRFDSLVLRGARLSRKGRPPASKEKSPKQKSDK